MEAKPTLNLWVLNTFKDKEGKSTQNPAITQVREFLKRFKLSQPTKEKATKKITTVNDRQAMAFLNTLANTKDYQYEVQGSTYDEVHHISQIIKPLFDFAKEGIKVNDLYQIAKTVVSITRFLPQGKNIPFENFIAPPTTNANIRTSDYSAAGVKKCLQEFRQSVNEAGQNLIQSIADFLDELVPVPEPEKQTA